MSNTQTHTDSVDVPEREEAQKKVKSRRPASMSDMCPTLQSTLCTYVRMLMWKLTESRYRVSAAKVESMAVCASTSNLTGGSASSSKPVLTFVKRPILTPKTVLPLFFAVGIIFAPIGGLLLYASAQVRKPTLS